MNIIRRLVGLPGKRESVNSSLAIRHRVQLQLQVQPRPQLPHREAAWCSPRWVRRLVRTSILWPAAAAHRARHRPAGASVNPIPTRTPLTRLGPARVAAVILTALVHPLLQSERLAECKAALW